MGFLSRLFGPSAPGPDDLFGTGLWRAHRDRFMRAVDRYYTTAVRLHELVEGAELDPGSSASVRVATARIGTGTTTLNTAAEEVDALVTDLHARHPVSGQVVGARVRAEVGRTPELLSSAALQAAQAAQAAAMTAVAVREILEREAAEAATDPAQESGGARPGTGADGPAASAEKYIAEVTDLLARARTELGTTAPGDTSGTD